MMSLAAVAVAILYLSSMQPCMAQMIQVDDNPEDIQKYLTILEDSPKGNPYDVAKQPVSVMWGIADTTATLGKLFQYTLPKEAFKGEVTRYKVYESGSSELPPWLLYDDASKTLRGIPGEDEAGQQYFIEVTAISQISNDTLSHAKDIFTINVAEDNPPATSATPLKEASTDGMKPIRCQEGSPVTMVTIIVDTDLSIMVPHAKIGLMNKMCSHLNIPPELLRMLPVGNKPMFDSSALVAGPGDVKKPQFGGTTIQWEVGCGNVNANQMPVLTQVESTSSDGSMGKALGHGIIGWHVTNNRPHAAHRMKRQAAVMPTATLMPTMGPPSRQPVPTMVIEETDQPVTRVVPTMASPTWPGEIHPSKTKHKHHHRTKTKGRHQHKTKHHKPKHSPTRKHHYKTKHTRTPMPTPTVLPIQPSRVDNVMATVVAPDHHLPEPTYGYIAPEISPTDHLQPSMTDGKAPARTEATEVLPTRTYTVPDIVTTEPIQPTHTDMSTPPTREPPISKPTKKPPSTSNMPVIPTQEPFNYAPILRNDIDRIEVSVGDVLNFKVPKDTFYDFEDGNTENLKLVFLTVDGLTLPPMSWVQFNVSSQTLYGLPLPEHEGRQEFIMAAIDRNGKIARDAFEIIVRRRPHENKINHEFSIQLDLDYHHFLMKVDARIAVAQKLASVFGDNDASKISVTRIEKGSVIYAWSNNSVPYKPCPTREIGDLLRYLVTVNNTLNQTFVKAMQPYRVMKAGVEPKGSCERGGIIHIETGPNHPGEPDTVESAPRETTDEDVLISTVIPAVVIAAMLLLAGCIACILYRKQRKGKLSDEDQHTFVNKGIPIIFADELEEKPDPPTKPLIMDDEKPPLPPPEYPHSNAGSAPSTPRSDHKEPFPEDYDMTSPLYQPPPPFTGSREHRQARPRVQHSQAYRNPPPYVPP
jgi:dystroglycan 1